MAWLLFVSPIGKAGIQPSGMAVVCVYSLVAWLWFVSPIGKAGVQPSGMAVVCVAYWQGGYTA